MNLLLFFDNSVVFFDVNMLFFDGWCKIFDVEVNGYVCFEGCGMILLKWFFDVVVYGDIVLVVIWGFVMN